MRALARPARPTTLVLSPHDLADVAARVVVRFYLRAFGHEEAAARAGDVEAVHQLRVATRRLRAALRLFEGVLSARFSEAAQRELAWLGDTIGAVRDLDVLAEAVTARAARLDPDLRKALGPLAVVIHDRRETAHAVLVRTLDSSRCRRQLDRLARFAEGARMGRRKPRALGDVASDLVRPMLRELLRMGRAVRADSPPAKIHRLRIRVKRLRYALETLRGLGGKSTRRAIARLTRFQDLLGAHQDAHTQVAWLRAYAMRGDVPAETVFAIGALAYALSRRGGKQRRQFPDAWRRLDRRWLRRDVVAELASHGRRGTMRVVEARAS